VSAQISGQGLLARQPMQPNKHITGMKSAHPPCKKIDIFLADRTRVKGLNIIPALK
jgi:hypothetical protein